MADNIETISYINLGDGLEHPIVDLNAFDNVEYNSQTKRINFKHGETVKKYIDATDFIKDGMVDSVKIATPESGDNAGVSCLVVTFNTDAGKEDIEIPISNIFNTNNYYTKTEVDNKNLWIRSDGTKSAVLKNQGLVTSANEVVVGKYNYCPGIWEEDTESVFTVGVGTDDDNRRNALVVKEDGTVYLLNAGYNLGLQEIVPVEEPIEYMLQPIGSQGQGNYFAWASSYDINEGDEVYADYSGEELAVDGEYEWYSEEEPWSPPIYGTTGFLVDGGLVAGFVYDMLLGYLSTDQSQKAYINTNVIQIGTSVYSDNTYLVSAVDGHYICVTGDVGSFDVTNGLISDITYEDEEEPLEEEGVMPADGMDPNAGGGEDIVPDDPGDGEEPLEEVPEEVEEEPEEVEEPENTVPLRSMKKAPLMRTASNNTRSYPIIVYKDNSVQEDITATYTDSVVSDEPITFDEEFYVLQAWGTDEQDGEVSEWEHTDFQIDIQLNGNDVAGGSILYESLSQQELNDIHISKTNGEFNILLGNEVPEEPIEEEEDEIVLVGYLQSDSSKKAYSFTSYPGDGDLVYSDINASTPAVNGHYISNISGVLSFDVTNGRISNTLYPEQEEIEEEVVEENREILALDLATAVRQGYFGRAQVYNQEYTVVELPEEEGESSIGDVFWVVEENEENAPMPNDAKVPYFILPESDCDILRLHLDNNTTRNFSISGNQVIFATYDHKKSKFLSNPAPIVIGNPQPDWNATTGSSVIKNKPNIPSAVSESTVSGWGFTKNSGTLTGVTFNGTSASVSNGVASISVTIPAAVTEATVSSWGFTKNTGTLTSESDPVFSASVASSITAADISNWNSKTSNTGTITGISMNGSSKGTSGNVDLGTVITAVSFNNAAVTVTSGAISISESDPVFAASVAASISAADISNWNSKTSNTGTITGISMNGSSKGTSGNVNLGTVVTGLSMNGSAVTVSNGIADLGTVLSSHQSIKTINGQTITGTGDVTISGLPAVSSSDNGKVLQVVNGSWTLVTPISIYSGSSNPDNSQGTNGDLYLQTS